MTFFRSLDYEGLIVPEITAAFIAGCRYVAAAFAFMWVALPISSQILFWFVIAETFFDLAVSSLYDGGIRSHHVGKKILIMLLIFSAVALSVQVNRAFPFPLNLGSVTAFAYIFMEAVRLKEIYRRAGIWFPDGIIELVAKRSKMLSITDVQDIREQQDVRRKSEVEE